MGKTATKPPPKAPAPGKKSDAGGGEPTADHSAVEVGNTMIGLWMDFRRFFSMACAAKALTHQDEADFLQTKTLMSRHLHLLEQKIPDGAEFRTDDIHEMMIRSVSLDGLRSLPAQNKKDLYGRWHRTYIRLQALAGTLEVIDEGHEVTFQRAQTKSANVKANLRAAQEDDGGRKKKIIVGVVVAAAVIAGAWFLLRSP